MRCWDCGTDVSEGAERCLPCWNEQQKLIAADTYGERWEQLAGLYLAGSSYEDIAAVLGTTPATVRTYIRRLRARGFSLPFRKELARASA